MTADSIVVRRENVVSRVVDGQSVIVEPDTAVVTVVSETGSTIWELINGKRTAGEIATAMATEYDIDAVIALEDTLAFLSDLRDKSLVRYVT